MFCPLNNLSTASFSFHLNLIWIVRIEKNKPFFQLQATIPPKCCRLTFMIKKKEKSLGRDFTEYFVMDVSWSEGVTFLKNRMQKILKERHPSSVIVCCSSTNFSKIAGFLFSCISRFLLKNKKILSWKIIAEQIFNVKFQTI